MGTVSQLLWLILIVAYVFRDRILGVGLAKWLSKLTGFRWSLDWLSLTLGLQNIDLVLSGFVWANPPEFEKLASPYFLEVRRVTLRLETNSLYRALADDGELHVRCLEVEGVTVHVERDKNRGLNLWGCLGFDEAEAAQITQEVNDARARGDAAAAAAKPTAADGAPDAGDDDDDGDDGDDAGEDVPHKARLARKQARRLRKAEQKAARRARKSAEAEAAAAEPDGHWGVPFELDCARCTFRGVKLHAADFLRNARAAKGAKGAADPRLAIQVKFLELSGSQLAVEDATDRTRRGPFVDELVLQKIVPAIINAALASNKTVLLRTALSAAGGNAGAAAKDAYQATTTAAQQGLLDFNRQRDDALGEVAAGLGLRKKRDTSATATAEAAAAGVSELRVRLLGARELTRNGARPSAYCVLRVTKDGATGQEKAVKAQSRACASTKKPEWREDFVLEVASLRSRFHLSVHDKAQFLGKDARMGEVDVALAALVKGEELVAWYPLTDPKGKADGKFTGEVEVGLTLA